MTPANHAVWRDERARVVGWLARKLGDLALAEEATQDALEAAAVEFSHGRDIQRPGAWLSTVAYRKAIGLIRKRRPDLVPLVSDIDEFGADARSMQTPLGDDLFALVFTCCHSAIGPDQQIALTLRHVCGLSTAQIAAMFLVPEPTMAKRLVRARDKIKHAGIAFRVPGASELDDRLEQVRTILYLTFTEGWLGSGADVAISEELCEEAIWLTRHLTAFDPRPETRGLLALMLLQHSRRAARTDEHGHLVEFARQDRTLWDRTTIDEAKALLAAAHDGTIGRYRVEAAIALLHVVGDEPDWARIADLYRVLTSLNPSPVVALNQAIAVGMADGPQAGLAMIDDVEADGRMAHYCSLHAARAEFLERAGNQDAQEAWRTAFELAPNNAYRHALERRRTTKNAREHRG